MKLLLIVALMIGLGLEAHAQAPCHVGIKSTVEVTGLSLRLADVLTPDTCPEVRAAAAAVKIGAAPSEGSVRVLLGSDLDTLLEKTFGQPGRVAGMAFINAPERIVVQRPRFQTSCGDIAEKLLAAHNSAYAIEPGAMSSETVTSQRKPEEIGCGVNGGIPPGASLELERKVWDPALRRWMFFARCKNPSECVPFIVRLEGNSYPEGLPATHPPNSRQSSQSSAILRNQVEFASRKFLVQRGQAAMLLWDQDGIRLTVPAVCLEAGAQGKQIRTRILPSGRVVRAIVVSSGILRAIS